MYASKLQKQHSKIWRESACMRPQEELSKPLKQGKTLADRTRQSLPRRTVGHWNAKGLIHSALATTRGLLPASADQPDGRGQQAALLVLVSLYLV